MDNINMEGSANMLDKESLAHIDMESLWIEIVIGSQDISWIKLCCNILLLNCCFRWNKL